MAAIEHSVSGEYQADEILVPGELLVDCEGRSDEIVSIERQEDGDLLATWRDKGVPVLMRYTPPNAATLDEFPTSPQTMTDNPASLLAALRDACQIADPTSTRFALDYIELCGDSGTIAATDGRPIRARGEEQSQPTELQLCDSQCTGEQLRISTDRGYLDHALRLGFRELSFYGANTPVQCSDETRHYLWALLDPESAIEPSAEALRVATPETKTSTSNLSNTKQKKTRSMSENSNEPKTTTTPKRSARAKERGQPAADTNHDLASLITEARAALREADGKLRALSAALKQHQKQFKLVRSTLSSLQQLQGIKAA
jgi:hypothetical protein